ncbi:MAG: porin [Thermoanaerobaculia bacterium]
MNLTIRRHLGAVLLAIASLMTAPLASAQGSLFYQEIAKDGRIYVFNTPKTVEIFTKSGSMGIAITMLGQGPNGETVVAENETALDLYNFKHDRPGYVRPAVKPAAPVIPTSLKIGDGELKFGLLLQGWYVADSSPAGSGTSWLGNNTGNNTFRIRRAEIKLNGKITADWGFEVMLDPSKQQNFTATVSTTTGAGTTACSGTDCKILQDLGVTFFGLKGHEFSLGQKKIAVTEEGIRSSSELDFAERAQVTRGFSDRRETGLFYKGEYGERFGAFASITNGVASNVNDDSNDTLFAAARFDIKPIHGLLLGVSGGTSGGETAAHFSRDRWGAHVKYDGPDSLPLGFRAEYLRATDGAAAGDLNRDGFYVTVLYTLAKQYQLGIRYDEIDNNKDIDNSKVKTITAGFHYLIKGKNINLKADYLNINQQGRRVNGLAKEFYNQFVLAAQVAF